MYPILLAIHSLVRWLVVTTLILSIIRACYGWKKREKFSRKDEVLLRMTVGVAQLQMLLGIGLYIISPIVHYFFDHLKEAIKMREIRPIFAINTPAIVQIFLISF